MRVCLFGQLRRLLTELAARTPDLWQSLQAIEIELAQGGILDKLMAKYYPKVREDFD